jgi:hypothetical protein
MRLSRRELMPLAAGAGILGATAVGEAGIAASVAAGLQDQPGGTVLGAGVHKVLANTTIKGDLQLLPDARIEIAAGRRLTVLGTFIAPLSQVLTGSGELDLNRSRTPCVWPEWWGARSGDAGTDNLPALCAGLAAHPHLRLLPGDYFISDTWVIDRAFSSVTGAGHRGTEDRRGTRLIVASASADVIRVGPGSQPPNVNAFLQNVRIADLALARSRPVAGDPERLPAGLRAQFLLFSEFERISANEHAAGFVMHGLVRSFVRDCLAFRSLPGVSPGQPWRGFLCDGNADIGLAGGNASLYLVDCNATIGGDPGVDDPVGVLLDGGFADSYLINFETAGVASGIRVAGRASQLGGRAATGHADLHIRMPVIDQCHHVGIDVRDVSSHGLIEIVQPYVAVAPGAEAGIRFRRTGGSVSIIGGQLLGFVDAASGSGEGAVGLAASDASGLQVAGLKVLEHRRPLILERCRQSRLDIWVGNYDHPAACALMLRDCEGVIASVLVCGQPGRLRRGVVVQGSARRIRIDATGIDPAVISGGERERVVCPAGPMAVPGRQGGIAIDGG